MERELCEPSPEPPPLKRCLLSSNESQDVIWDSWPKRSLMTGFENRICSSSLIPVPSWAIAATRGSS
jgi:hypothetical protein